MRPHAAALAGLLVTLGAGAAHNAALAQPADPPRPASKERCLAAYEQGQRLRLKHALREAKAELLLCARAPCPENFRPECVQWFDQVEQQLPSVIIQVAGEPALTDVRVLVDDVAIAERLDGVAIEVDPGEHVFRFEPKGAVPQEQKVLIIEGQKGRVLTVDLSARQAAGLPQALHDTPAQPHQTPAQHRSLTPWIFTGVSGLALASFAYFGATGLSRRNDLDACTPYCDQRDIDGVRKRFIVADASLAISAVSLGIAIYAWLSSARSGGRSDTISFEAGGDSNTVHVGIERAF